MSDHYLTVYLDPNDPTIWVPSRMAGWSIHERVSDWLKEHGFRSSIWGAEQPKEYQLFGSDQNGRSGIMFFPTDREEVMLFKLTFGGQ